MYPLRCYRLSSLSIKTPPGNLLLGNHPRSRFRAFHRRTPAPVLHCSGVSVCVCVSWSQPLLLARFRLDSRRTPRPRKRGSPRYPLHLYAEFNPIARWRPQSPETRHFPRKMCFSRVVWTVKLVKMTKGKGHRPKALFQVSKVSVCGRVS